MTVWAMNPSSAGETSYFQLFSYADAGLTLIDKNEQAAKVTISEV